MTEPNNVETAKAEFVAAFDAWMAPKPDPDAEAAHARALDELTLQMLATMPTEGMLRV